MVLNDNILAHGKKWNCCGWHEFYKLAFWGYGARYKRIVVLDFDIRLLRSVDHLFHDHCLEGDAGADMLCVDDVLTAELLCSARGNHPTSDHHAGHAFATARMVQSLI